MIRSGGQKRGAFVEAGSVWNPDVTVAVKPNGDAFVIPEIPAFLFLLATTIICPRPVEAQETTNGALIEEHDLSGPPDDQRNERAEDEENADGATDVQPQELSVPDDRVIEAGSPLDIEADRESALRDNVPRSTNRSCRTDDGRTRCYCEDGFHEDSGQGHSIECVPDVEVNIEHEVAGDTDGGRSSRARFLTRLTVGYIPPGFNTIIPEIGVGVNWRLGYHDFRLVIQMGPTVALGGDTAFIGHIMAGGVFHYERFYLSLSCGLSGGLLIGGTEMFPFWSDEIGIGYYGNGLSIGVFARDLLGVWNPYTVMFGLNIEYVIRAHSTTEYVEYNARRARAATLTPVLTLAVVAVTLFFLFNSSPA
jgi:hypothetical protein